MSAPSKTWASCMMVLAGGPTSSAGVPYSLMRPFTPLAVMCSARATAAAMATGVWALCWSPWKLPWVPRSASYSPMSPRVGPSAPAGESHDATKAVSSLATPVSMVKPLLFSTLVRVSTDACSCHPTSGLFPMWSLRDCISPFHSASALAMTASRLASFRLASFVAIPMGSRRA